MLPKWNAMSCGKRQKEKTKYYMTGKVNWEWQCVKSDPKMFEFRSAYSSVSAVIVWKNIDRSLAIK